MNQWQEVLKSAGFPTTALVLDFETYFDTDYSLKKMSTVEYVCDDRFEILGVGMQLLDIEDGEIDFWPPDFIQEHLAFNFGDTFGVDLQDITLIGQNLKFDALILREHFGIIPKYTVDIKDLSRHLDARNKHSLEAMAKRHGAPKLKGDTKQFKDFHWADMDAEMRLALEKYGKGDVEIETFLFKKLLPLISNPEIELPLANQTLQLYLNPQVVIDKELGEDLKQQMQQEMVKPIQQLNAGGIPCKAKFPATKKQSGRKCKGGKLEILRDDSWTEWKLTDEICSQCNGTGLLSTNQKEISGNISFVNLLAEYLGPNEQIPMKQGKNKMIPALAKDDEGMRYLLNHNNETVRQLATARLAIKSWPLHIGRIDNLINQANCRDGKIGMPLTYYAAHVGKWGGTEDINVQNFGGRGRKGAGTHPLIRNIRQMITAPDGYIFGLVDFAQIELRITAWLAGQSDLVQALADGRDVYSEFATNELFQQPIRKSRKTDPKPIARMLTFKRGFAKDGTLGFTYGMGTNRLYEDCRANDALRPAFDSGEYDWDFIDRLIKTLRRRYSKIPTFWREVEKMWKFVTKYPSEIISWFLPDENITIHKHLKKVKPLLRNSLLTFYNRNDTTIIQLPSGRNIYYPRATVTRA
jgi:DNA polymerase